MMIGIDTSAVAGNTVCDWKKARAAGARFAILKKSQGSRQDTCYARDSDAARKAGLVVGGYFLPVWGLAAATPKRQVAVFRAGPGEIVRDTDIPPVLDVESNNWPGTGRTKTELVEMVRQCVFEIRDQFGCWPMVYTSYNQWYGLGLPAAPWAKNCPLWIKTAYRVTHNPPQPVDQVIPVTPHLGPDRLKDPRGYYRYPDAWANTGWMIQQFQGNAKGFPGMTKIIDVNRFHVLRKGYTGPEVSWVSRKLLTCSSDTVGPQILDEKIDAAIRGVQKSHGLIVDGIVGAATFAAIAWRV